MPTVPSLLKAADLASAHVIRGRLDAEGFRVEVVHEHAANLWGGAVTGGPVVVVSAAGLPEIEDCVAEVEQVEPPREAADGGLPEPAASPGIGGSALIGVGLAAIATAGAVVMELLSAIKREIFSGSFYNSGPIPLRVPDWEIVLLVLAFGAAAGALIHLSNLALRNPVLRIILAAFLFLCFSNPIGLVLAMPFFVAEWILHPRRLRE